MPRIDAHDLIFWRPALQETAICHAAGGAWGKARGSRFCIFAKPIARQTQESACQPSPDGDFLCRN
ncbi:MAG: hypothetical protein CMO06_05840 [Thalassospira sp.]|nr:hypothetical protein [Thalassospira sp.]